MCVPVFFLFFFFSFTIGGEGNFYIIRARFNVMKTCVERSLFRRFQTNLAKSRTGRRLDNSELGGRCTAVIGSLPERFPAVEGARGRPAVMLSERGETKKQLARRT